ncbi:MAG: hypothetical protein COB15_11585 [Flavobacteriales bacterium]|nr:MAG: hypothetical protein COB15_11585 [Flavobacteriales bacterium]
MKNIPFLLLSILIPVAVFSQEKEGIVNQKFYYGIEVGLNFSKLNKEDIDFSYGTKPLIGLFSKHKVLEKVYLKNAILYSRKGSTSKSLKLENSYLDVNIIPQYKLSGDFFLQAGFSYSHLLASKEILINGSKFSGLEKNDITGFESEKSIVTGVEFKLQKNINLEFNYFIPLATNGFNNFQIGLTFLINNKSPKKEKYKQLSKRRSKEQIEQLKSGTLLVRLKTSVNKINALKKVGQIEKANKVKQIQEMENKAIIAAFKKNFTFCKVAFFHSYDSEKIRNKNLGAIFLNDSLLLDNSIQVDANKPIFTAEFGTIEKDATKQFSHSSQETDGNRSLKNVNHYYGGTDFRFQALLIKDDNFIQLSKPFPYYVRAIYKSMKKHPEQALFLAPILPFQPWSYDRTVEKMNMKLSNYFKRNKKK